MQLRSQHQLMQMFLVVQECLKVQVEWLLTLIVPIQVVMLVVLDLIITLDSDLPNYMLATRSPTCGKQSCTDNFEYGFEGDASKDCDWAAKKSNKRCKKKDSRTKKMISFHCPSVCDSECTKKKRPKKSKGS